MIKVYKKLTSDQLDRGVIFSSCLSKYKEEMEDNTIHEVLEHQTGKDKVIENLKDDKFFNKSPYKYNIIRR